MLEYFRLYKKKKNNFKSTRTLQFPFQIMSHLHVFHSVGSTHGKPAGGTAVAVVQTTPGGRQSNRLSWSRLPAIAGSSWGQPVVFSGDTFIVGLRFLQSTCQSLCRTCVALSSTAVVKRTQGCCGPGLKETNKQSRKTRK